MAVMYEAGIEGMRCRDDSQFRRPLCVAIYGMKNWSLRRFHFIYRAEVLDNATRHDLWCTSDVKIKSCQQG